MTRYNSVGLKVRDNQLGPTEEDERGVWRGVELRGGELRGRRQYSGAGVKSA